MEIKRKNDGEETVLAPVGCLDTVAAPDFAAALEEAAGAKTLVIDFSAVDYIASSGIRVLVSANRRALAEGRKFVLTGLNEVLDDIFDVTGLKGVFTFR